MAKPVVDFPMNEPVEVRLHWPEGRIVAGRFGERVMYSLDQPPEHVMFLDLSVAQQINMLEPGMNPFILCKRTAKRFDAWKPEQPARTGASVSAPAPAVAPITPPSRQTQSTLPANHNNGNNNTPSNGHSNGHGNGGGFASEDPAQIHLGWAQFLLATTNGLTDVYAAALAYASQKHGNAIKAEDVRALLTTAYIAQTKTGGPHVA
jgi:hypothetical protein